jgi:hypothetical protein|tara:strand:+ start:64 stop:1077 length:1014 start_codon:yes stop_codon:yes gene_type:complete
VEIFIDESGSFVCSKNPDSWCVVAAYVISGNQKNAMQKLLTQLKIKSGKKYNDEIKLKNVKEKDLKWFISELSKLDGSLYFVAVNASELSEEIVGLHKEEQADKIVEHKDKMQHQEMRTALEELSEDIKGLSSQLYLQLICQTVLINDILKRAILYYVQFKPSMLSKFRWRIDQKNTTKIIYEESFEKVCPPILQSMSISDPHIAIKGANYNFMEKYIYKDGEEPGYLKETYGIDVQEEGSLKAGKILRDDLHFEDSKGCPGVQVADLLASSCRRALRNGFDDNTGISRLIGSLMVSNRKGQESMNLISLVDGHVSNKATGLAIQSMTKSAKPLILS